MPNSKAKQLKTDKGHKWKPFWQNHEKLPKDVSWFLHLEQNSSKLTRPQIETSILDSHLDCLYFSTFEPKKNIQFLSSNLIWHPCCILFPWPIWAQEIGWRIFPCLSLLLQGRECIFELFLKKIIMFLFQIFKWTFF